MIETDEGHYQQLKLLAADIWGEGLTDRRIYGIEYRSQGRRVYLSIGERESTSSKKVLAIFEHERFKSYLIFLAMVDLRIRPGTSEIIFVPGSTVIKVQDF